MTSRCLILLGVLVSAAAIADAKCIYTGHTSATVQIVYCSGIELTGSKSKSTWPDGETFTWQKPGAAVAGTLLSVEVLSSVVETSSDQDYPREPWKKGAHKLLYLDGSFEELCPETVPTSLGVRTIDQCCDVLPYTGTCLIPKGIVPVAVVPSPKENQD